MKLPEAKKNKKGELTGPILDWNEDFAMLVGWILSEVKKLDWIKIRKSAPRVRRKERGRPSLPRRG